ncbi:MAG: DUF5119 domain-containing protein [Muribaculaceae bacterium]
MSSKCRLIVMLLLPGIMLGLSSCNFIYEYDNCPPDNQLTIVNDWKAAPDAAPEGMAYLFFPDDGGATWRYDFPSREAGGVNLLHGSYSFLSYNDDTYNVRFKEGDGYSGYVAYTDAAERMAFNIAGDTATAALPQRMALSEQPLVKCPDMMWGCSYPRVDLADNMLSYLTAENSEPVTSSAKVLTVHQRQLTARYSFIIHDVENLAGVKQMSAMFGGLAGSLNLATGAAGDYPSVLPSKAVKASDTSISGNFITFGLPLQPDTDNVLSLLVQLTDGRKFNYEFNVTDQVRRAPDPLNVHVELRGLKLEVSDPADTGAFDVNVDGWTTVVINING